MPSLEHVAFHLETLELLHGFVVRWCGSLRAETNRLLHSGASRAAGVLRDAILAAPGEVSEQIPCACQVL